MSEQEPTKFFPTEVPMINLALSGKWDGGASKGVTLIAGKSKHFKTLFGLVMLKAWFKASSPDAVCIFYDTEGGATLDYFEMNGIDTTKVIRKPVIDVEQMKEDFINTLHDIDEGDEVFFFFDSLGNIASRKERDDAMDGSTKADMTRAKQIKSLMRIIYMPLDIKALPCVIIGHTYDTQEMYSKQVVSGGTGAYYNANTIWIITRSQEKERQSDKEISGYKFTINIEKSRFVKEKSKFPITVKFKGGINSWSGLFDLARELGYVDKATAQTYERICLKGIKDLPADIDPLKTYKEKNTNNTEFWGPIFKYTDFMKRVESKYLLHDNSRTAQEILGEGGEDKDD